MVDAAAGTCQAYNADDFEGAAERLLGEQISNFKRAGGDNCANLQRISEAFFSGELGENDENQNDISLMLTASTEFFLRAGQQLISDSQPQTMPRPKLELADLLRSDTPPDRADFCVGHPPQR